MDSILALRKSVFATSAAPEPAAVVVAPPRPATPPPPAAVTRALEPAQGHSRLTRHVIELPPYEEPLSMEMALRVAAMLNVSITQTGPSTEDAISARDWRVGMDIEREHGAREEAWGCHTNIIGLDAVCAGQIALAHLCETYLYYDAALGFPAMEQRLLRTAATSSKPRFLYAKTATPRPAAAALPAATRVGAADLDSLLSALTT